MSAAKAVPPVANATAPAAMEMKRLLIGASKKERIDNNG
jgi:hypothetical protein